MRLSKKLKKHTYCNILFTIFIAETFFKPPPMAYQTPKLFYNSHPEYGQVCINLI